MIALAFALVAAPPPPVWSFEMHRLVCDIAWRELTPTARAEARRLLATETPAESFAEACTWADRVRGNDGYRWTAPAHYVNLPRGAAGVDRARDCDTICVVTAIPRYLAALADGARSDSARREALKFVAHFVGDLHQPLHAGYADDRGGNDVRLLFAGDSTNLHRLWDGQLARAIGLGEADGARLHAAIAPVDRARWRDGDPVAWANESFALTERQVYAGVDEPGYVDRNRHAIIGRIQAAGVRLGLLLNRALDPPSAEPADVATIEAIMAATYAAISGPAGPRDWERFRTLFGAGARLIPTSCTAQGHCGATVLSVEDYIARVGLYFNANPFYEVESHRIVERYGSIAHVFSTYESRRDPTAEPFVRGINTFQLRWDGQRWWVMSILWADETSAGPIPERYRR